MHALADLLQPRVLAAARIAVFIEERGQLLGEPEALIDLAPQPRAAVRGGLRCVAGDDERSALRSALERKLDQ